MKNKFKTTLILLLLISFCGGSSETATVEDTTTTSSSSTSTSTSTTSTTSSTSTTTTTTKSLKIALLPELKIQELSSDIPEYNRDDWPHWDDSNKDCQDTRQEVLIAESFEDVVYEDSEACRVSTGKWFDSYTGIYFYNASDLDIDHLVPLKNVHNSGGYAWDRFMKSQYANDLLDPDTLIAVSLSSNRSKGARGPDEWKPTNKDYWCEYALDWARIKFYYNLTVTQSEWDALVEMVESCPEGYDYLDAEAEYVAEKPKPVVTTTTTSTTTTSTTTTSTTTTSTTTTSTTTTSTTIPSNQPANPGDSKNCGDFSTYAEAKEWFDRYYPYYGDIAKLDRDDDLEPCESLPGAP
jgi:hypothetical protein